MPIKVDRFFDIETRNWDSFVIGGIVDSDDSYLDCRDEEDFFDELLSQGGQVWSWTDYDLRWFCEVARRRKLSLRINLAGSRITRIDTGDLHLRDAYALVLQPLARAARIAGIAINKDTGLPCVCPEKCGGYCFIGHPTMEDGHWLSLRRYLEADVRGGMAVMRSLIDEAERCGYRLGGTVGGSAMSTLVRQFGIPEIQWDASNYHYTRSGFYGGRTEVFQPKATEGHASDINSAYPFAFTSVGMPSGFYRRLDCDESRSSFHGGGEGIFTATVCVPSGVFIPPLPMRTRSGRVVFPTGVLTGAWTALELRYAIELGYDIEIWHGIGWAETERPLGQFMSHVWDCRDRAKAEGNEGLREWHKRFGNSCYGKFAESPDKERVLLHPDGSKIVACSGGECLPGCERGCRLTRCCDNRCRRRCKAWRQIDRAGYLWAAPFWRIPTHGHVHWAAYATAATRIKLHRQLVSDNRDGFTAIYCDTDSVYSTERRLLDHGPRLGEWEYEGPIADWFCLAPKTYRYQRNGEVTCKAKGLEGITAEAWEAFARGETITRSRGVKGLLSAAQGEALFSRKAITRTNRRDGIHFGGRKLSADGKTYPMDFRELRNE